MKLKFWILFFFTSLLFINCGEDGIKNINLEDAIFKAEGSNPSWKLEIDSKNGIHFYSYSKVDKIITTSSKITELMDVALTSYYAETESVEIKVAIFKKQCIDSKESREFKHEVRVSAKNNVDDSFTTFKGCGDFVVNKTK